jgi:hypothetical protein
MHACGRLALALMPVLTGCVSSKFQMAPAGTPAAVMLNLPADPSPIEAYVDTVITYHGPGSWKRHAYWDEYVLSLTNRSIAPATLLSAMLIDANGEPIAAGDRWPVLEKESRAWWDANALGQNLALGAGAVFITAGAVAAPVGVLVVWAAAEGVAIGASTAATFVALPLAAAALYAVNERGELRISEEFDRRRLKFPLDFEPRETRHGSLFFRLTPSPQKLKLTFRVTGQLREVVIDLSVLADLHRRLP